MVGVSSSSSSTLWSSSSAPSSPSGGNLLNMPWSGIGVGHLFYSAMWVRMSPMSCIQWVCHSDTGISVRPIIFNVSRNWSYRLPPITLLVS
ncbi:hypothetical protein GOBAR_DD10189 [Gossypium barbadense]|nr:hypothetical protein GOBAR_DD10189 [Gossypium barbadense]